MRLIDANRAKSYKLTLKNPQELPQELRRRGIQEKSPFIYAGKVGPHHVLKFGGMRIAIHDQLASTLNVEEVIDENRSRREPQ